MRQRLQFTAHDQFNTLLRKCIQGLSHNPADANQWFIFAQACDGIKNDRQALRFLQRAMVLHPNHPTLMRFAGTLSKRLNLLNDAEAYYKQVRRLLPADAEVEAELADIESRQRILATPLAVTVGQNGARRHPISVNLLYKWRDQSWLRQTPGARGEWGSHRFVANQDGGQSDWVVVFEDLDMPRTVTCRQGNLILATGEPPSISRYGQAFIEQFDLIVTPHAGMPHPRVLTSQIPLPWHIGLSGNEPWPGAGPIDYDLLASLTGMEKAFAVSAVVSDKTFTEGHRARVEFLTKLQSLMGDSLHLYGRGYCEIPDKWAAISPYKFHLCLENFQNDGYWTEKLSDAYLGWSIPIYYGCRKVNEMFDPHTLCGIDIHDPEGAHRKIVDFMERHRHSDVGPLLGRQRAAILNGHNMFNRLAEVCADAAGSLWRQVTLYPQSAFSDRR